MRFCLEVLLGAAVLGNLSAASMAPSAASGNPRAVWVVKVDTRSGKLVRTLVAPPKPDSARIRICAAWWQKQRRIST